MVIHTIYTSQRSISHIGSLVAQLGAGLQSFFEFDSRGFEFALVALFVVLLIEQAKIMNDRWLLILALCAVFVAHFLVPEQFLLVAISLCLVALLVRPKRDSLNG